LLASRQFGDVALCGKAKELKHTHTLSLLKNELKVKQKPGALAISRGSNLVAMMQTADLREGK
jgi:hypothetical protein